MKSKVSYLALGGLCLALSACSDPVDLHARAPSTSHDDLSWLSGCWSVAGQDAVEVWSESFDGLMFGYSVTKTGESVSVFEDLRIERREAGAVYIASPFGTGTTEFVQSQLSSQSVTFENPAHDFPQKLRYWRKGMPYD